VLYCLLLPVRSAMIINSKSFSLDLFEPRRSALELAETILEGDPKSFEELVFCDHTL
jgi:hypothetical protein